MATRHSTLLSRFRSLRSAPPAAAAAPVLILLLASAACSGTRGPAVRPETQLGFGVQMAQQGLWEEALFRFQQAERAEPGNAQVLNNLAVAYEAVGDFDRALDLYKKALAVDPENRELKRNYARFVEFYQSFRPQQATAAGLVKAAGASGVPGASGATAAPESAAGPQHPAGDPIGSTTPGRPAPIPKPGATPPVSGPAPADVPPSDPPSR